MGQSKKSTINQLAGRLKKQFGQETTGHDWWHIERVWKLATYIGTKEKANMPVVELAALLHDIADSKFHRGSFAAGPYRAKRILQQLGVDKKTIQEVLYIVGNISFKKIGAKKT